MNERDLIDLAGNAELLEIGRKAIEDHAISAREARFSTPFRGNGFVVKEKDGASSSIIRFGPETALRLALLAIADHMRKSHGSSPKP